MNGDYVKKEIFFDSALVFYAPRMQNLPKPKTKTDVSLSGDVSPYRVTNSLSIERRPRIGRRFPYRGLSRTVRKTNNGQHRISFLAPSVWNNLPNEVKLCTNLNMFKHKVKEYFLYKIRQKDNNVYLYDQTLVFTKTDAFFLRSDFMPGSRLLKTQILNARHPKN